MKHIHQIGTEKESYTVVDETKYASLLRNGEAEEITIPKGTPLEQHPAFLEHPEKFEITETDIPEESLHTLVYLSVK